MKYYSEILKEMFDTAEACTDAEKAAAAKAAAKAKKEAEIDELGQQLDEAKAKYENALNAFLKEYGRYEKMTTDPIEAKNLNELFDRHFYNKNLFKSLFE